MNYASIDFETHYYPPAYIDLLKKREAFPRFYVQDGEIQLAYNHALVIPRQHLLPKFMSEERRIKDMDADGIDRQVVSIPLPGCDLLPPDEATKVCRVANDGLASLCERHPDRFIGLALVPVQDSGGMREELKRSAGDLGLSGLHLHSNALGKMLDSKEHRDFFELASQMRMPVFIHPTIPYNVSGLTEYRLASTFGLQLDLSLSLLRMIFSGIFERSKGLKVVVSHLGSTLPYISHRLDDEFDAARPNDAKISNRPSEYIRKLYVDTVTKQVAPLEFAVRYFGSDHVLFGSDYPFWNTREHMQAVAESSISAEDKEKIFGTNALGLLRN